MGLPSEEEGAVVVLKITADWLFYPAAHVVFRETGISTNVSSIAGWLADGMVGWLVGWVDDIADGRV